MKDPHISYVTSSDATLDAEKLALAALYRLVLDAQKRKAAVATGGEKHAREECKHVSRDTSIRRPAAG